MNDLEYYSVYEFVADYKSGWLTRREMMKRVLHIAGGVASAASVLTLLGCGGSATVSSPAAGSAPASSLATASTAPSSAPAASSAPASALASGSVAASPAASSASAKPSASAAGSTSPASSASGAASGSAAASASSGVPNAKSPISVAPNDPAVDAKEITFQGNGATLITYEARPKNASGVLPVVMVCHENMGLTDHIRDVARRYAKQGYLASALDLLSRQGGTAKVTDTSKIPSLLSATDALTQEVGDFKALAQYYAGQGAKAIGMNGFCFGGGIVWRSTEELGDMLKAAVPFYGAPPPLDQVSKIKAAVYGVYSADPQDFANNNRDQLFAALKAANVTADFKAYPGTRHAFNNDTGQAYNQEQALAAWQDTLNWFAKYLKA